MGTWINGASVNRAKPQLPKKATPSHTVLQVLERAVVVEHDKRTRVDARGFIKKFIALFAGYSEHSGRSHKRYAPLQSTRTEETIVSEVRAFFAQRPRPWRWHGNRQRRV